MPVGYAEARKTVFPENGKARSGFQSTFHFYEKPMITKARTGRSAINKNVIFVNGQHRRSTKNIALVRSIQNPRGVLVTQFNDSIIAVPALKEDYDFGKQNEQEMFALFKV
jgi:hypothetical protein